MHFAPTRMLARAVIALALTAATIVGPGPAAFATGSVASPNGVLYDGCQSHPFTFTVQATATGVDTWFVNATLIGPTGVTVSTAFETGSGSGGQGGSTVTVCDYDAPGTYRLSTRVRYMNRLGQFVETEQLPDVFFSMAALATSTTLGVSTTKPRFKQNVKFRVTSLRQQPTGMSANDYESVALEKRVGGVWKQIRGSATETNDAGWVSIKLRWRQPGKTKVRAVTMPDDNAVASYSAPVKLKLRKR